MNILTSRFSLITLLKLLIAPMFLCGALMAHASVVTPFDSSHVQADFQSSETGTDVPAEEDEDEEPDCD